ncbi:hypothetical protein ElyMa_000918300 [Elysia marginata]|uniref:Uncharacterized protein n=1 Tax=Elysia marginata TaxID=1093978 RepID=A0AAV4HBG0_9GAST|nr:hypothetical protein ElyMa_000918300 [Elysia marginata]
MRMTRRTRRKGQHHLWVINAPQGLDRPNQAQAPALPVPAQALGLVRGLVHALETVDLDQTVARGRAPTAGAKGRDQIAEANALGLMVKNIAQGPGLETGAPGRKEEEDIQAHQGQGHALLAPMRTPNGRGAECLTSTEVCQQKNSKPVASWYKVSLGRNMSFITLNIFLGLSTTYHTEASGSGDQN